MQEEEADGFLGGLVYCTSKSENSSAWEGREVWYLLSEGLECMSYSSHGTVREDGWVGGQISCCLCR